MSKNKSSEEIRAIGKKFLDELKDKGPNLDLVGKTVVRTTLSNSIKDELDETLSEARKFRRLRIDIVKEMDEINQKLREKGKND
jgi:hypothetical protein